MAELKGAPKPKEIAAAKLAVADDFAEQEERERDEMRLFATNVGTLAAVVGEPRLRSV